MAAKLCRESVFRPARTGRQGVFRLCTVFSLPRADISQKKFITAVLRLSALLYIKCRAHSCGSHPDYRTIPIKELSSPASGRFSLSAAALHILAMVLMLMDHLWATLLPAQDWLTCAGRLVFLSV